MIRWIWKQKGPLLAAALVAFAGMSCSSERFTDGDTAIDLRPSFALELALTQLEVERDGKVSVVPPEPRMLTPKERIHLVLPDETAGKPVSLSVWGLANGVRRAHATTHATPMLNDSVEVEVELLAIGCEDCGCTDECQTGVCAGDAYRGCGQLDADPCLELLAEVSCAASDACDSGTCVPELGCESEAISCLTPPASGCKDGATLRVYDVTGTCDAGSCSYSFQDIACPNCPACDPCNGVTCNQPPNGCYAPTGACQNGACTYALANGNACNDGNACTANDSCGAGKCTGTPVVCQSPPALACLNATTLRSYASTGACQGGVCTYAPIDVACPFGCAAGKCKEDTGCCSEHATPGCSDPSIAECVCAWDSYCCSTGWDAYCASGVEFYVCGDCP